MADKTKTFPINYDGSYLGNLILAAENPDSIGWNASLRRWYAPTKKGYDKNNFGIGVDRKTAQGYLQTDAEGREYLTENDERNLRNKSINDAERSLKNRENYATKVTGLENNASEPTKAKVVSYIYNMGSSNVAKSVFDKTKNELSPSRWYKFMESYLNDDFNGVSSMIDSDYRRAGKNERVKNESKYFELTPKESKLKYSYLDLFKSGGKSKIHIKKSTRGSFTKYCNGKVTNECIQRGKNSPNPKIRKKAVFALNSRRWHHKNGGLIQFGKIGLEIEPDKLFFSREEVYKPSVNNYMNYFSPNTERSTSTTSTSSTSAEKSDPWAGYIGESDSTPTPTYSISSSTYSPSANSVDQIVDALYFGYENGSTSRAATPDEMIAVYTPAWEKLGLGKYDLVKNLNKRRSYDTSSSKAKLMINYLILKGIRPEAAEAIIKIAGAESGLNSKAVNIKEKELYGDNAGQGLFLHSNKRAKQRHDWMKKNKRNYTWLDDLDFFLEDVASRPHVNKLLYS